MNATLIESLRNASGGSLSFTVGLALLAGLLVWLALEIFRALLRLNAERNQNRVALAKSPRAVARDQTPLPRSRAGATRLERPAQIFRRQKNFRVRRRRRVLFETARRPSAASSSSRDSI